MAIQKLRAQSQRAATWKITPALVMEDRKSVNDSILRILAFASKHNLDVCHMLNSFASEHWGIHHLRIQSLTALIRKHGVVQAIAMEGSFSPNVVLTLRVAEHFGLLNQGWDEVLECERVSQVSSAKLWSTNWLYWIVTGCILTLIALFITYRIGALTNVIVGEFNKTWVSDVRMPSPSLTLTILALIPVCLLFCLWGVPRIGQWLHGMIATIPMIRNSLPSNDLNTLRILALTTNAGIEEKSSLSVLAKWHHSPSVRARLKQVLSRQQNGESSEIWSSLVEERFLRPVENSAIVMSKDHRAQAWILRHLASRQNERNAFRRLLREMYVQPTIALIFGFFVLWLGGVIFHTMSLLVQLLSREYR